MYALLLKGVLFGVFTEEQHARDVIDNLGLQGAEVKPATFGEEAGKVKLHITWKLEKFAGDEQSPETLLETMEGEG